MKKRTFAWIAAVIVLAACGGQQHNSTSRLKSVADEFGYDTIAAQPDDMLCNESVDDVLRHYPEFYHATRQAKKAYERWAAQEQEAGLKTKPEVMDIARILDETLDGSAKAAADSAWQALPTIDSLYLQLIASVPDEATDKDVVKSEIGRSRKAWQSYVELLKRLAATVPEDCQECYLTVVGEKINKHLMILQQIQSK